MIVDTTILSPFEEKFVHISNMKIIILVGALFGQEKDIHIPSIDLDTVTDSLSKMMNHEKAYLWNINYILFRLILTGQIIIVLIK